MNHYAVLTFTNSFDISVSNTKKSQKYSFSTDSRESSGEKVRRQFAQQKANSHGPNNNPTPSSTD
jgi:hypothetical protein